jgi:NDP-sugar pyrophosphorylase family protein
MLMAAGLGTRLRPFTDLEPKILLPVMGVPCAQFAIDAAVGAGVRKLVANIHHLPARTQEGLRALEYGGAELVISDESAKLLGSAGGIARALPHFGGKPFFLLNADVLCDVDLDRLARRHAYLRARHGVKLTLTLFERPEGRGAYREIMMSQESGLITGFGEVTRGKPYFVGAAILEPEAVEGIRPDEPSEFVPRILEPAIRAGKAGFFLTQGKWFDVGSPELWAETHFQLMGLLEHGRVSRAWRTRIESVSRRIGQRMWASRSMRGIFPTADWQAPAYFGDLSDSTVKPPRHFGPRAVLYGQPFDGAEPQERYADKVSYRGVSLGIPVG